MPMLHGFFAFWVVAWCRFVLSPVGWAWLFKLKPSRLDNAQCTLRCECHGSGVGNADIQIIVPTEMDETLASLQSTPKFLSQNSTNEFTDTVQRQDTVVLKIEPLHSRIFEPRDPHRKEATLEEKAECRLDVCLLDTLVFIGRER